VDRLGPHPATTVGLGPDPEDDGELTAWWMLACLLDTRRPGDEAALAAYRTFEARDALDPESWASTGPELLTAWLEEAGHPRAEAVAAVLWRGGRALVEHHGGSLVRLARECDDLEQLGGRLAALAPGFGRGAVARFLQPLRGAWAAAAELPLDPAARAAAVHLGWLDEGEDEESGPGTLLTRLAHMDESGLAPDDPQPRWVDVEAALGRLGRRACLRERVGRCPLGPACPRAGSLAP
jgi:hypothetical protein